ncbi:hypothetical protein AB0B15_38375 [Streptomyces sp. NPDC045456]|uniref:hypothetical protein n=1 Tax=Streptomyces sp. NPDC045456 TaxID=3155254 RepID=UPI0034054747
MENTPHPYTETTHARAEAVTLYHPEPMHEHPLAPRPAAAPASIPTVVEVRTLDGHTIYRYADVQPPAGTEAPAATPAGNAVPAWAKTTSLLFVSASASLALAALATRWFAEAAASLAASLLLLAKVAIVLAFVVALVAAVIQNGRRRAGKQTATATATATAGLFGRAKATATATINNR